MKPLNIDDFQQRTLAIRIKFLTIFSLIAFSVLAFFSLFFLDKIYFPLAVTEWIMMILLVINYIYLRKTEDVDRASYMVLFLVGFISLVIFAQGGMNKTGNLWIIIFPLLAFYLLGEKKGFIAIGIFSAVLLSLSYAITTDIMDHPFSDVKVRNTLVVFYIVVLLSFYNEKIKMLATNETSRAYRNLRRIFENMQDAYYRLDVDGRIQVLSDSSYALMGYRADDVIGKRMLNYYSDKEAWREYVAAFNQSEGKLFGYEIQLKHKDGHTVWVLLNAQKLYNNRGEYIGIEGTVTNICAYKKVQQDLVKLNQDLEKRVEIGINEVRERDKIMVQQAKFAQMGELLAMIAHQWRQPLSAVTAITSNMKISLALEETISNKELEKNFNNIDEHILMLSRTIDDFRNFFRGDKKHATLKLDEAINKALLVLKPALKTHSIALHVKGEFVQEVDSLESEIMQVLINIINNAIDVLKEQDIQREITIYQESDDSHQIIKIQDNGGGIDEAIIDKIFEPYFSTKKEKNGTGLGLYMSKTIIDEHCKGKLSVGNREGGVCFCISLPNEINQTL